MIARGFASMLARVSAAALVLAGCGGESSTPSGSAGSGGAAGGVASAPAPAPAPGAASGTAVDFYPTPAAEALSVDDVQRIVAQAAEEAGARNRPAVIAVTDRVGNVLALFTMPGALANATLRSGPAGNVGLQGVAVPATLAAITKAITGAYLSSGGNAFSTRTASMIVQQQFPPSRNTAGLESGPLFGVQFSQLACSDVVRRLDPVVPNLAGPKRSPLGLAADPGGMPLYKNGVLVGGIGIMADGDYGFDPEVIDTDRDDEEIIALAGSTGFEAPAAIRAERISVDGTTLRFADAGPADLRSTPAKARPFTTLPGALTPVAGYFTGTAVVAGTVYGREASGVRRATAAESSQLDAFVLSDGTGMNRFPIRAGLDPEVGAPLSATEVRAILDEAFAVMSRARAQIRRPLDSRAQVSISIVDTRGNILGLVRSPDAPIFGADVSAQKARSAAFFSSTAAASDLQATGDAAVRDTIAAMRAALSDPAALSGQVAFTARALGNLARPSFPDGEIGRPPGPLSLPIAQFSPFATGLQTQLVAGDIATHVAFVASGGATRDVALGCTGLPDANAAGGRENRLRNGLQIFPGGVPIYRGSRLVGAIGVSGDGIDQDDMIAFLGADAGGARSGGLGNAPAAMRSDQVTISTGGRAVRLRFVGCPFAPFLGTSDQNVCAGK